MQTRATSLFWHFDYARLDDLHFVFRSAGTTAAEGQRASVANHSDVGGAGGTRHNASGVCQTKHRHDSDGCARAVDSIPWHRISPGGGWYQPDAAAVDRCCGDFRHSLLMERRASRAGVFRLLPGAHRRRVRRVSELRSISATCLLRNRHHSEVLSHRHLGLDASMPR